MIRLYCYNGLDGAVDAMRKRRGKKAGDISPFIGVYRTHIHDGLKKDVGISTVCKLADILDYDIAFVPREGGEPVMLENTYGSWRPKSDENEVDFIAEDVYIDEDGVIIEVAE